MHKIEIFGGNLLTLQTRVMLSPLGVTTSAHIEPGKHTERQKVRDFNRG